MWNAWFHGGEWMGSRHRAGDAEFPEDVEGLVAVALMNGTVGTVSNERRRS